MKKGLSVILLALVLMGCADRTTNVTASSSLVDFLYPKRGDYVEHEPEMPTLTLPVNMGIAFVPASYSSGSMHLSAKEKHDILKRVKDEFIQLNYVHRIEIISDNYLTPGGSFETLDQLSRLYNIDLIALVSYDQVSRSNENNASLLYWTIAGMYLIPGNSNTTQTFIDTALFDIDSRKMLFRAPGISKVGSLSTAVGVDESLHEDTTEGFDLAVNDMVTNLNTELDTFKIRVKEEKIAHVETREGFSLGGGSVGGGALLGMLWLAFIRRKR
ncbi:rhombotarget lipoprotein [Photobacterium japonica]|uniref:rhombotarget lipoprotein n=1 Tax=Photobacterium japonica TaxID=2910235 RepID=UPI003D13B9FE